MAQPVPSPLQAAIDRLAYHAQYLRDVAYLAGPGGQCRIPAASAQALHDGLAEVLMILRSIPQLPAVGGTPTAPPPASGG